MPDQLHAAILEMLPHATNVVDLQTYRPGYLPYPARVTLQTKTGGFAKFLLWADDAYGWGAGAKAGLVERYLYDHDVAPVDFWGRLVLRGLHHVQGTSPESPPDYMLHVIVAGVQRLKTILG